MVDKAGQRMRLFEKKSADMAAKVEQARMTLATGKNRTEGMGGLEPGVPRHGWQFFASQAVEECFFIHGVAPRLTDTQQALVRSQCGPLAAVPFTCCPTSSLTRFDAHVFRVLLLRLWRPLPLSSSVCRCGRPLDAFGHHRSACAVSGVLGRRGFALESAAARVCREAGGRVSLNVRVGDLDLPPRAVDQRRLEVVVDGLPLFHGAQFAIDTTMVSPVRGGRLGPQCARVDGAALACARRRKEATYPELLGANGRARLVVLSCEVGGRWSDECQSFLRQLSKARVREPPGVRASARHALQRWSSILACCASRSLALWVLAQMVPHLQVVRSWGTTGIPVDLDVSCDFFFQSSSSKKKKIDFGQWPKSFGPKSKMAEVECLLRISRSLRRRGGHDCVHLSKRCLDDHVASSRPSFLPPSFVHQGPCPWVVKCKSCCPGCVPTRCTERATD